MCFLISFKAMIRFLYELPIRFTAGASSVATSLILPRHFVRSLKQGPARIMAVIFIKLTVHAGASHLLCQMTRSTLNVLPKITKQPNYVKPSLASE